MATVKITKENFQEEVAESNIPVVVDFWAPWCMPCRMMGPVFEELSGEYEGKVKFAKVNTEEEQEIAAYFQIRGIPSLSVIIDGGEVSRIVGFSQKESLKEKIDKILKKK
jgi:thioredoxin 1